ncbi:normal lung function maintenance, low in lung cancer 1 protein domain-containing protein [Phthorimaea operculella]|nr:normal lung function maintenance, low in lung cancer 1 protein domain-containing protein [Phthorimaea operculella]
MTERERVTKYDPNTEAFQMRAQWKKTDICRKMWNERWDWLLDERNKAYQEAQQIREAHKEALPQPKPKLETTKSLKPVPVTSTGFVGWLASKPECQLEIYPNWLAKPPVRAPDAWEYKDYTGASKPK